jgi:chaperone modulatory protein CbpM
MMESTQRPRAQLLGEGEWLGVAEICRVCRIEEGVVVELAELGVIVPRGATPGEWQLSVADVPRLRIAARLMRDLGVNVSGAALAVELLDVQHDLERRVQLLTQISFGSPT